VAIRGPGERSGWGVHDPDWNVEQLVSSPGIVDADTQIISCGDESVTAWGEPEAHDGTVVLKGGNESNASGDTKDAGGLVT